jgi:hypothetical protein
MTTAPLAEGSSSCPSPRALCGWSPPPRAADTPLKRAVDRYMPRTGLPVILFFAAVVGMLALAPHLPKPRELAVDALAAAAAGAWCGLNFWRCRHAHCLIDAIGWSALALIVAAEAIIGRSFIHGDEQLIFLGVLAAGLIFEAGWSLVRGTNAVVAAPRIAVVSTDAPDR